MMYVQYIYTIYNLSCVYRLTGMEQDLIPNAIQLLGAVSHILNLRHLISFIIVRYFPGSIYMQLRPFMIFWAGHIILSYMSYYIIKFQLLLNKNIIVILPMFRNNIQKYIQKIYIWFNRNKFCPGWDTPLILFSNANTSIG